MRWTASHGFTDVDTWPVASDGIDYSVIKNQVKGPVSSFVHGSREPFMGVYHPHTNAGVAHYMPFAKLPPERLNELLQVNTVAVVRLTRTALDGMVERGHGAIINVASLLAFSGAVRLPNLPLRATYAATKAFTSGLSGS